jgi:hypothetical protein
MVLRPGEFVVVIVGSVPPNGELLKVLTLPCLLWGRDPVPDEASHDLDRDFTLSIRIYDLVR